MNTILVCDDEKDIVSAISIYLKSEGFDVVKASNGKEAIEAVKKIDSINLAILDIMMPEMDGLTALNEIRSISNIPVILLTAKTQDSDKVIGLNLGADDYVTKPFNPVELLARVKSQLRRFVVLGGEVVNDSKVVVGGIVLDDDTKTVTVEGAPANLTPTEFGILKCLMSKAGKVCSPKDIYKSVWGDEPVGADGAVAVHIRHLREKIEIDPANPRYIKVMWGQGYKIEEG